jgi:hypothetical protein
MIRAVSTYCSGPKRDDDGMLPAYERYRSQRIRTLAMRASWDRRPFFILSGEYGLITANTLIPWYDHLLLAEEVDALVPEVVQQLELCRIDSMEYHTGPVASEPLVKPYFDLMSSACAQVDVKLEIVLLPVGMV